MTSENMIEIKSLNKKFGNITALNNLNLTVKKGELLGLIGSNGAGKTTTIRMISCILHPDKGTVKIGGYDITENPIEIKSMMGYLPEEPNLYERFTAYDLLKYFGELYGVPKDKIDSRIIELLTLVGMEDRAQHQINTFSKGLRQRIGIARALIHDPEIIIFDEPTMGLDPATSIAIRKFIKKMKGTKTIILCTHYMDEADALCDRVAILNQGTLLDIGTPNELKSKIHGDIILHIELKDLTKINEDIKLLNNHEGVNHVSTNNTELNISLTNRDQTNNIIKSLKSNISSITTKKPTLEDVFIDKVTNYEEKNN